MWETREGHADRLLLVPDGYDYTAPVPFPEHKFVIALNTIGSDHPIFNATFYSLISYFMAAKFGLPWMQDFCSRYGHPMRTFHVQNARDEEQLRAALQEAPDVHDIFLHPERSVEITPIPAAAGNPHEVLLRVAENACHQAILGQTLTSDTSENGGSRAQAQVHLGVQKAIVQKRAEYVARVLNRQLIPAIVRLNYGHTDGLPLPELRYSLQDEAQNAARAEYWSKVLAIPGMRVAADVVYESLRIPQPAADEQNVLSTPENTAAAPTTAAAALVKKNAECVLAADEGTEETEEETARRRPSILNRAALAETLAELFRAAYVGDDAPEKATAARGECRSEDPEHCRVHGTPLKKPSSYPKKWKPLPDTPRLTPQKARETLRKGIKAKDPLGNNITLDESILKHWQDEGKTVEDINNRLSYLPVIEQSIHTPAEIWEAEDGTRVYMAAFHTRQGSRIYPLSFTVNKDQSKIRTYFPNERYINTKRKGKLLYEAKVTSDAQSP